MSGLGVLAILFIFAVCIAIYTLYQKMLTDSRLRAKIAGGGEQVVSSTLQQELEGLSIPSYKKVQIAKTIEKIVIEEINLFKEKIAEGEKKIHELNKNYEGTKKSFERVTLEKKQTESVIRSLAEGLIVLNDKGEPVIMNPAAEKLLGFKKEEVEKKSLFTNPKVGQVIALVGNANFSGEREIVVSSHDDHAKKIIRSSSAVIENEAGQTVGMVSVLTDITQQREIDDLKSKFVASMTHELKTPVISVLRSLEFLLGTTLGGVNPKQHEYLDVAHRNIIRLSALIDNILNYSKIEGGVFQINPEVFLVATLIQDVKAALKSWASSRKITLLEKMEDESLKIYADPDRLFQVLQNLIGNAIRFTPEEGTITLEVKKISPAGSMQEYVEIGVEDTGLGISEKDQKKIFKKFSQGSTPALDGGKGTGLGLVICKEIVHLHGGNIQLRSAEKKGSRFTIILPIDKNKIEDEKGKAPAV